MALRPPGRAADVRYPRFPRKVASSDPLPSKRIRAETWALQPGLLVQTSRGVDGLPVSFVTSPKHWPERVACEFSLNYRRNPTVSDDAYQLPGQAQTREELFDLCHQQLGGVATSSGGLAVGTGAQYGHCNGRSVVTELVWAGGGRDKRSMKKQPSLGIFWIYHRRVLAFKVPVGAVAAVRGVKDSDYAHADLWTEVVIKQPKLAGKEYWVIPRGRIIFREKYGIFAIFASTSIVTDPELLGKIIRCFHLPPKDRVRAITDRHYDPPDDDLFDE